MAERSLSRTLPGKTKQRRERFREAGFTLLELLVVITILGLLTAAVGTVALNYLDRARSDTAQLQVDQLQVGLDLFRLDVGRFPTEEEGLVSLIEQPGGNDKWNGPYIRKRDLLEDPWGRPFVYANPGRHGNVDVFSLGADNAEGGEDENQDITSW